MEGRKQFTFYRSFYDAVCDLPKKDRLGVYEAIITYALDNKDPGLLSGVQKTAFTLVKPVLDASWKKAAAGKQGGSKPKAKSKQTESKREKEEETEKENENEIETETEDECLPAGFGQFWAIYPVKLGKENALQVWERLRPDTEAVCDGVKKWRQTKQWTKDNGRFIPRAAKFLEERHYDYLPENHIPPGASGVLGKAELESIERIMRE